MLYYNLLLFRKKFVGHVDLLVDLQINGLDLASTTLQGLGWTEACRLAAWLPNGSWAFPLVWIALEAPTSAQALCCCVCRRVFR